MNIFSRFYNFAGKRKIIEATPANLALILFQTMTNHLGKLEDLFIKEGIPMDESQHRKIFFHLYSLYFTMIFKSITINTANILFEKIINISRDLILKSLKQDSPLKKWIEEDNLFDHMFYRNLEYYYNDKIEDEDQTALNSIMQFCNADKSNSVMYLTAKLQYKIADIKSLTPQAKSFIPLWIDQVTMIISYAKYFKNIKTE